MPIVYPIKPTKTVEYSVVRTQESGKGPYYRVRPPSYIAILSNPIATVYRTESCSDPH